MVVFLSVYSAWPRRAEGGASVWKLQGRLRVVQLKKEQSVRMVEKGYRKRGWGKKRGRKEIGREGGRGFSGQICRGQ